ncbi:MarR family transcriptional regulator [Corynebacterium sp. zg912]|uniref:MarR family transcriptional regulator n=1 Tax=Corynebacterium wankanglinii TaxID=2735136 RepID=A0A7H0K8D7_9CORY|nr:MULTISPECIES: MarR family transcriptional regulator [Corynebacterium]MBA1836950.1 MarR family transcriptional regulator [Corynebacterium wankanglinii]MCR5927925.1 MarR family transcriptional regulator [Corynebacterium sp. zg912]QNP93553.1 MarR family transcriptional regulator [Corynebacterium wankanglinii]
MIAVHARYRGREKARATVVERSAEALSGLPGVAGFEVLGVEDIRSKVADAEAALNLTMALLSDGNWAIGLGIADGAGSGTSAPNDASVMATKAVGTRPGQVRVIVDKQSATTEAADIAATFALMAHVLHKRTYEGREATSLVRRGMNQNEAAATLGISKQAMSQRLQAAGWPAEQAGWQLALNLITRAAGQCE